MASGHEVEEYGRVYGEVASDAKSKDGEERREGDEVGRAPCRESEDACEEEGNIEGPPATPDVTSEPPEDGADEETNVEREREERPVEMKLVDHGAQDEASEKLRFARDQHHAFVGPRSGRSPARRCHCRTVSDRRAHSYRKRTYANHPNPATANSPHCAATSEVRVYAHFSHASTLTWYLPIPISCIAALRTRALAW